MLTRTDGNASRRLPWHDGAALRHWLLLAVLSSALSFAACSGASRSPFSDDGGDAGPSGATPDGGAGGDDDDDDDDDTTKPGSKDAGNDTVDGVTPGDVDPEAVGPEAIDEASGTKSGVAMHAFFPKSAGKVPVVVFAHGFQVAPSQYDATLRHLASHGYVAMTADYAAGFGGNDNNAQATSILDGLAWAKGHAKVGPHADTDNAGMSGHSLGGKLALLAATLDPRVKASIVLDPVDGNGVTVADLLPDLHIPTAFLGETLDSTAKGLGQACAPKNANYSTFYAQANSPSIEVTLDGASHMSFLDNAASCGLPCTLCKDPTASTDDIARTTRGFLVAFYERHLKNRPAFDAYLSQETDLASIKSK